MFGNNVYSFNSDFSNLSLHFFLVNLAKCVSFPDFFSEPLPRFTDFLYYFPILYVTNILSNRHTYIYVAGKPAYSRFSALFLCRRFKEQGWAGD